IIYLPLILIVFPNVDQNLMKKSLKLMYVSLLIFIIWPSLILTYFNQFYYLQAGRYRFISYFNNPNELAQFSLVFLLLSFYYLFIEKSSIKKYIWNLLFGCSSFYIILLTGSRAVLLAISIFVIIYFSTVIFHIEKKQRNFIFMFTFLIILLVLFSNYLLERNTGVLSYIDQLSSYRLSIWREILKYKNPLLFLIGGYLQSHKQYQVITNAYVELFGNYGLIGLICWCLTLLNFSVNKRVSTKFDKYKTAAICAYLVYYLFESGMQNIVNISSFFFWFTLCVGKMSSKGN
ncbi:O-antigen ligase family protein, partial [Enterococcus faecium]